MSLLVAVLLVLLALPALAQEVVVTVDGMSPAEIQVEEGASVTFRNDTDEDVRLLDDAGRWDSGTLAPGDTFSLSFDDAGEVTYASEDGSLQGTIVVGGTDGAEPTEEATAGDTPSEEPTEDTTEAPLPEMAATGIPAVLLAGIAAAGLGTGTLLLRRR